MLAACPKTSHLLFSWPIAHLGIGTMLDQNSKALLIGAHFVGVAEHQTKQLQTYPP